MPQVVAHRRQLGAAPQPVGRVRVVHPVRCCPGGRFVGGSYEVPAADYATSQAWAQAIHGASSRWDGIRYVSRQMNKGFAYAIFLRSGLLKLRAEKLKARQVDDLCDRFNVTAV